jgi:hypothetical protein
LGYFNYGPEKLSHSVPKGPKSGLVQGKVFSEKFKNIFESLAFIIKEGLVAYSTESSCHGKVNKKLQLKL